MGNLGERINSQQALVNYGSELIELEPFQQQLVVLRSDIIGLVESGVSPQEKLKGVDQLVQGVVSELKELGLGGDVQSAVVRGCADLTTRVVTEPLAQGVQAGSEMVAELIFEAGNLLPLSALNHVAEITLAKVNELTGDERHAALIIAHNWHLIKPRTYYRELFLEAAELQRNSPADVEAAIPRLVMTGSVIDDISSIDSLLLNGRKRGLIPIVTEAAIRLRLGVEIIDLIIDQVDLNDIMLTVRACEEAIDRGFIPEWTDLCKQRLFMKIVELLKGLCLRKSLTKIHGLHLSISKLYSNNLLRPEDNELLSGWINIKTEEELWALGQKLEDVARIA